MSTTLVLLRFREHADAISGDIQAIFFNFTRSGCYLKTNHCSAFSGETWKENALLISINGECYYSGPLVVHAELHMPSTCLPHQRQQ